MSRSILLTTPRLSSEEAARFYGLSKTDYRFVVGLFKNAKSGRALPAKNIKRSSSVAVRKTKRRESQAA
jgi:hypothetical protein